MIPLAMLGALLSSGATQRLRSEGILLSTVLRRLGSSPDGELIQLVEPAWRAIVTALEANPQGRFEIPDRKLEELIAAQYDAAGFDEVILTPRSGDRGRDVIATRSGFGSIRIIEQVKAFGPGRVVTADDVRSLLGVLHSDQNASKGLVTTTARFAPGIASDPLIKTHMPYRLELVDGDQLIKRLSALKKPVR